MNDLICMRFDHMQRIHPKMIREHCDECQAEVGVFPSGQEIIKNHGRERIRIVCDVCYQPSSKVAILPPQALREALETKPK